LRREARGRSAGSLQTTIPQIASIGVIAVGLWQAVATMCGAGRVIAP